LAAGEVLDGLGQYDNPAALLRLARMHGRNPLSRAELLADSGYREAVRAMGNLA